MTDRFIMCALLGFLLAVSHGTAADGSPEAAGDLTALTGIVRDARGNDVLVRAEQYQDIEAYMRFGAYDAAADILEAIVSDYGPWLAAILDMPLWAKAVAAEPRLQALQAQYRAWRDSVTGL